MNLDEEVTKNLKANLGELQFGLIVGNAQLAVLTEALAVAHQRIADLEAKPAKSQG